MPSCSMVVAKLSAPTVTVVMGPSSSWSSCSGYNEPACRKLPRRSGPVRHPEPDLALDHDGARTVHPADAHGYVGVLTRPLRPVGLGDAGDVAGRLRGVGDLHPLRDPALGGRDAGL